MASKIKIFDFTLTPEEAQTGKGVDLLIAKLRPEWPKNKITHKVFSGGQVNCMMVFFNGDDKADGIVVRIYGGLVGSLSNRANEVMCMQLAYHQHCFPEIFAFFTNGIAYGFSTGRLLTIKEFEKPDIARTVARSLCNFHNADMKEIPLVGQHGEPATFDMTFDFYTDMRKNVSNAPPGLSKDETKAARIAKTGLSRDLLLKEIDALEGLLEPMNLPKSVTHYDYHQRNGIYEEDKKKLIILDLEMVKLGYEAFDIGGLFVEGPWRRLVPHFYDESGGEPANYTEELRRLYAREYITRKYEILGRAPSDVTDDVIQLQYLEHEVMAAAFHLFWIVLFVVTMDFEGKELPTNDLFDIEWNLYKKSKEQLPTVRNQYLSQRAKVEAQQKPH